jgi:rod shape-determining protein MreD
MMDRRPANLGFLIGGFVVALALEVLPLPTWAEPARPGWVIAALIWWCLNQPQRVNVGTAFLLGITLDVLKGTLLGQHALALSLVAATAARFHLQLRVFPLWQQTSLIGLLTLLAGVVLWWTDGISGRTLDETNQLGTLLLRVPTVITTALLWPWLAELMRSLARRSDTL